VFWVGVGRGSGSGKHEPGHSHERGVCGSNAWAWEWERECEAGARPRFWMWGVWVSCTCAGLGTGVGVQASTWVWGCTPCTPRPQSRLHSTRVCLHVHTCVMRRQAGGSEGPRPRVFAGGHAAAGDHGGPDQLLGAAGGPVWRVPWPQQRGVCCHRASRAEPVVPGA